MSLNHSASVIEIMSVELQEGTSKAGKPYIIYTCPSLIHCDSGELKVGNVKMVQHAMNRETFTVPKPGRFHPVYEPRPHYTNGECLPELVRLVPASAPAGSAAPARSAAPAKS